MGFDPSAIQSCYEVISENSEIFAEIISTGAPEVLVVSWQAQQHSSSSPAVLFCIRTKRQEGVPKIILLSYL